MSIETFNVARGKFLGKEGRMYLSEPPIPHLIKFSLLHSWFNRVQPMAGKPQTTSAPRSSSDEKNTPDFKEKTWNLLFQNGFSDPNNQNLTCNVQLFHPFGKSQKLHYFGGLGQKPTTTKQISKTIERKAPLLALDQLMDCVTPCPWRNTFRRGLCLPTVLEQTWEYLLRSIANRSLSLFLW